jgi:hypothetical protein
VTTAPVDDYATHVERFKPKHGLAATNSNDLRRFVYDWFAHLGLPRVRLTPCL